MAVTNIARTNINKIKYYMNKKNIHIVVPQLQDNIGFIPYAFLSFKTYYKFKGKYPNDLNWVPPLILEENKSTSIYIDRWRSRRASMQNYIEESIWQNFLDNPPDIYAFGGYLWNIKLCYRLAKRVRDKWPDCLIIAGGPDPAYLYDKKFFIKHPYIDIIVPGSGEMPLTDILDEYLSDNHDWENCTDIVLPDVNNGWKKSNKITNFREFNWPASIILDNETLIRMYLNECKSNNKAVLFLFESTKGCPYHCTFCDWGSATYSKVRIKPLLMCEQEIKWMAEHDVDHIYVTDANFGLVKEHIKVAEYFAKYKLQTNYPSKFKVFTPKNSKNTFNKIIPILNNAGLFDMYIAEVQDLNEEVLNNVKRQEISWEEHLDVFKEAQKVVPNLSINLDTIIGMPGQTINTLLKDVDKILSYNNYI